jgi:L-asparaginase
VSRVAVVFTGGTISMRVDAAAGGAVPTLDGAALLAATPGLEGIAELVPIDWGLVPASHVSFAQLIDLAATVRRALDDRAVDGAVVVQGTDVIEETSFALDLLVPGDKPVVVVGAMRTADAPDADGPRNLRDAIRCAADPQLRGQGTVVVMAGTILPADDAVKIDSGRLDAFGAPNAGLLGQVDESGLTVAGRRIARRVLPVLPDTAAEPIPLVTATVAMDGTVVRFWRSASPRGFVVAATGSGNTDPDLLAACRDEMARGVPVVLASRCLSGGVRPAYAFPGGGATWQAAGAILAGTLSAPKARVALALGLGAGLDGDGLRDFIRG